MGSELGDVVSIPDQASHAASQPARRASYYDTVGLVRNRHPIESTGFHLALVLKSLVRKGIEFKTFWTMPDHTKRFYTRPKCKI